MEKMDETENFKFKEGGWGWCVVIASAICFGTLIAFENEYSLIYDKFIDVYNTTENKVTYSAWIGSSGTGLVSLTCILSSLLVDFFGERIVGTIGGLISTVALVGCGFVSNLKLYFLTYSFIFSIGQSMILESSLSILPHYFSKRLGLASGLMNLGGAGVTIGLPFAFEESFNKFGLEKTFFFLAALLFLNAICALTFKPQLKRIKEGEKISFFKKIKSGLGARVWRKKKFIVWIISSAIFFFGYMIPTVTAIHYAELRFSNSNPAVLAALLGSLSGISSIVFGKFSDFQFFSPIYFHVVSFFMCGVLQIAFPYLNHYYELCIMMALLGIVDGLLLNFIVPISCEVAELPELSNQAIGYFFAAIAIPEMFGPVASGAIFEKYNSYTNAYYLGGGCCILAAILLFVFYPEGIVMRALKWCIYRRSFDLEKNNQKMLKKELSQSVYIISDDL